MTKKLLNFGSFKLNLADFEEESKLQGAHVLLLTRSAFFARALSSNFLEQRQRTVHLGIVEDLGLWRPGEDASYVQGAFRALLRYFYTGHVEVEARCGAIFKEAN